jgi:hypothetical protein
MNSKNRVKGMHFDLDDDEVSRRPLWSNDGRDLVNILLSDMRAAQNSIYVAAARRVSCRLEIKEKSEMILKLVGKV